ncbi:hypothetical protein CPLU01_09311 [Colletotrichum plurivorum]|uniref:Uncharacterized protein n=1 Tax=Colletotrichum plurivorum TaxID=2175906 RepID=A0A8H6K939_9PEZI|nr:hypothetical protein CPLU01_09311 [Colletotrichum plurivorum]
MHHDNRWRTLYNRNLGLPLAAMHLDGPDEIFPRNDSASKRLTERSNASHLTILPSPYAAWQPRSISTDVAPDSSPASRTRFSFASASSAITVATSAANVDHNASWIAARANLSHR